MVKNFHRLVEQKQITITLTKRELDRLQEFLDDKVDNVSYSLDLLSAMWKLGLVKSL